MSSPVKINVDIMLYVLTGPRMNLARARTRRGLHLSIYPAIHTHTHTITIKYTLRSFPSHTYRAILPHFALSTTTFIKYRSIIQHRCLFIILFSCQVYAVCAVVYVCMIFFSLALNLIHTFIHTARWHFYAVRTILKIVHTISIPLYILCIYSNQLINYSGNTTIRKQRV